MNPLAKATRYFWLGAGVLMALSSGATWWVTRNGVGLHPDSAFYLYFARTFAEQGTMPTLTLWPPGYPAALAAVAALTGDFAESARWIGVVMFSVNILLLALLTRRVTRSALAALILAALFALSPLELYIHAHAISESLCLACWLLGLYFLLRHQETPSWKFLLGAAAAAAAAWLCRYVGIVQVVAGTLFLLVYLPANLAKKIRAAAVYAFITATPMALWLLTRPAAPEELHNEYGWFGSGMHRALAWYGFTNAQAKLTLSAMTQWLVPLDQHNLLKAALFGVLAVGVALLFYSALKNSRSPAAPRGWPAWCGAPVFLFLLTFLGYKSVFYLSALVLDPFVDLSTRVEGLGFGFVLLLAAAVGRRLFDAAPEKAAGRARQTALAFAPVLLAIFAYSAVSWLTDAGDRYLGFATTEWRHSPAIAAIKQLPPNRPIYTKWNQVVLLLAGRKDTHGLPMISGVGGQPNPNFEQEMARIIKELAADHGVIVAFRIFPNRAPPIEWLRANPALRVYLDTPDAIFFEAAPPKAN